MPGCGLEIARFCVDKRRSLEFFLIASLQLLLAEFGLIYWES
jgi:hypothetical protein